MTLKHRSRKAALYNARQAATEAKVLAGDVIDITQKLEEKQAGEKAAAKERVEHTLADIADTMASDPGFQQAARKRAAEHKMREHAAGPQLFQRGDRVVYAGQEEAIPADWRGRIVDHEWFSDHNKDPQTGEVVETREHHYIVKWYNPKLGQYHEGLHHQDELKPQSFGSKTKAATNLTADQLAIMNFIRKSGKEKVTVREIEKSRFGNTPWFKSWLKKTQPKKDLLVGEDDISFADVQLPEVGEPRNLVDEILRVSSPVTLDWNDEQAIFPNNKIFALTVEHRRIPQLFSAFGENAVQFLQGYNDKAAMSGHPTVPGKTIVAWVRYSEMEDGTLWVHEVQTDMFWAVGARHITRRDAQEAMSRGGPYSKEANYHIRELIKQRAQPEDNQMKLLEFEVMKEFVAAHPNNRIVFPTSKYRIDNYPADMFGDKAAPASVYNEIPRKMRFEKKDAKSLNLPEAPAGEVWVYASMSAGEIMPEMSFAAVSRAVRAFLAAGQPSEIVKASTSDEVAELVKAVASDADMAKAVLAGMDGKVERFGLAKLKVLAEESGSLEAKKLFAAVVKMGSGDFVGEAVLRQKYIGESQITISIKMVSAPGGTFWEVLDKDTGKSIGLLSLKARRGVGWSGGPSVEDLANGYAVVLPSGSLQLKDPKSFAAFMRRSTDGSVASAAFKTQIASDIKQKAKQLAKDESSKNQILSLLDLSYTGDDFEPLAAAPDLSTADEELQDLVYGGPYADYTVGDIKALAVMLGLDLSKWSVDTGHYAL